MFDTTLPPDISGGASARALNALRAFADEHGDALRNAAALLGGAPGLRLASTTLERFAHEAVPSQRTMRGFAELVALLMLEHIDDPSRIEASRFAEIDPASPCVAEICLLADELQHAFYAYREVAGVASIAAGKGGVA